MINSSQNCKEPEDLYGDRQENLLLPPVTLMKNGECGTFSSEIEGGACKVTRKYKQRENISSEQWFCEFQCTFKCGEWIASLGRSS